MKNLKKGAALLTCILSLHTINPATSLYAKTMTLTYDGKEHTYNNPPITLQIENKEITNLIMPPVQIFDRVLVPAREVFEPLGATIEWKAVEKKAFINYGETLMILQANNKEVWIDGKTLTLDVPVKIVNDKVMLPVRFIGESLGFKVDWNNDTRNVNITKEIKEPEVDNSENDGNDDSNNGNNNDSGNNSNNGDIVMPGVGVSDVQMSNKIDEAGDTRYAYTIYFDSPVGNYTTLETGNKIVVDIDDASNLLKSNILLGDNPHVSMVRSSQFTTTVTRVVFDTIVRKDYYFELSPDRKALTIHMEPIVKSEMPQVSENIGYTYYPKETISFKKVPGITVDSIQIKDDYRNKKITITLPGLYADTYGSGIINVGSNAVDKVQVESNNVTTFTIFENKIRAFDVIDDGERISIVLMEPREKYNKIVLLDMGHGASDPGTSGNGLVEKNLNFTQGMHVYNLLKNNPDIKVYVTREDDSYPTNPYRAQLANEIGVDLFVSMHNNSFGTTAQGTEVLYATKNEKNKQIAEIFQRNMVNRLGTKNRGVKVRNDLIVLNSTQMPGVLIETAFLSNMEDAEKLRSPEFNQKVGQVVYESIIEIFNTLSFR